MLTVQSASPDPALQPFIRTYVQREAHLDTQELVEPVVARLGVMLEFEFAGSYEVRNYGSETIEDPNAISVIGPPGLAAFAVDYQRTHRIARRHVSALWLSCTLRSADSTLIEYRYGGACPVR